MVLSEERLATEIEQTKTNGLKLKGQMPNSGSALCQN
jgi:hypothetical protein